MPPQAHRESQGKHKTKQPALLLLLQVGLLRGQIADVDGHCLARAEQQILPFSRSLARYVGSWWVWYAFMAQEELTGTGLACLGPCGVFTSTVCWLGLGVHVNLELPTSAMGACWLVASWSSPHYTKHYQPFTVSLELLGISPLCPLTWELGSSTADA